MRAMGFRRSKDDARLGMRWREFRGEQEELFDKAGLPGSMADRRIFDEFLMEGFVVPCDDVGAFDIDELRPDQREALGELATLYVDRFPDPGVARVIELLMPEPS
jgi:hypothetical protein